jgi:hypothetical protein
MVDLGGLEGGEQVADHVACDRRMTQRSLLVDDVRVAPTDARASDVPRLGKIGKHPVCLALGQPGSLGDFAHRCIRTACDLNQDDGMRRDEKPFARRNSHGGQSRDEAYAVRTELTLSISCAGVKGFWMNGPSAPASV